MAGNALAGLAAKMGTRASDAVGAARGSMFGVAQEAVKGQYAAEAQERAHGHSKKVLKKLNKKAADGTVIKASISGKGDTAFEYTKGPSRDAQGFRRDQPDHVSNAKEAANSTQGAEGAKPAQGAIENRGMAPTTLVAAPSKPMRELSGPRLALDAPKGKSKAADKEEGPNSTRGFVNDEKGGTRSVDRRDSSFAEHLTANESKYLSERQARLATIKQASSGIKTEGAKMEPKSNMGSIVNNANQKFDDAKNRMDQKFDNLRNKTNIRIDNAAGARDSLPASYRNKPKGRPATTPKSDDVF
jgi:hypothetical protein